MGLLSIPVKRYSRIPGLVLLVLGTGLAHPFAMSGAINSNATFTGAASGLYGSSKWLSARYAQRLAQSAEITSRWK